MQAISKRGLGTSLLAAGAVAVAAVAFTGSAAAEQERAGGGGATLKMKVQGEKLDFFGPKSVGKGEELTVINRTPVEKVGPHTFTLIKSSLMDSRRDMRRCERFQSKVCQNVLEAHQVGPPPDFPVGKPNIDAGKRGWDKEFTNKAKGDSWYTEELGETETRKVTARAGEELGYFCLIHPFMRGKLEVK